MNKLKLLILLSLSLLFLSCSTVKQGFINQKKNSSDEFMVEKKLPLVMPPDYNELPVPSSIKNKNNLEEKRIKNLIINENNKNSNPSGKKKINKNFEESLLEKIKKN